MKSSGRKDFIWRRKSRIGSFNLRVFAVMGVQEKRAGLMAELEDMVRKRRRMGVIDWTLGVS